MLTGILMYLFLLLSATCGRVWDKVGKKIPLTTLWLGVARGILFVDTVRLGGMLQVLCLHVGKGLSFPHHSVPRTERPGGLDTLRGPA